MTNAESLRLSLSTIRKKQRSAATSISKAYRKAYGIKALRKKGKIGNTRKHSAGQETAVEAAPGSLPPT
jgi:hypothetical protein